MCLASSGNGEIWLKSGMYEELFRGTEKIVSPKWTKGSQAYRWADRYSLKVVRCEKLWPWVWNIGSQPVGYDPFGTLKPFHEGSLKPLKKCRYHSIYIMILNSSMK